MTEIETHALESVLREVKIFSIVDDLLERIADSALIGDAEMLHDLSSTLWNVASIRDCLYTAAPGP